MNLSESNNIKIVKTDDIAACLAIRETIFIKEQKVPTELEIDEYDKPDADCEHYLITENGVNVGTFRCIHDAPGIVHMQRLCILKEMRGKGCGYAAMAFLKEHYRQLGEKKITLGAQCHAIPFYESCGFTCVSDVFLDAGIEHRTMEFHL